MLIEWGDAILPVLPHDFLEVRLTFGPGDDDRLPRLPTRRHRVGAPRADALTAAIAPWAAGLMLILGITTSTAQVGCAIGGHEGVLGAIQSHAWPAPRRDPHAGDRVPLPADPRRAERHRRHRRRPRARACSPGSRVGVAAAKALSHARRLPMIGVTSLDLLAFPLRHSPRRIVCAIDAGRGRDLPRQLPASARRGPARSPHHRWPSPDDLASDLQATGDEVLLVGDGALRYRGRLRSGCGRSSSPTAARPTPSPVRSCSSPTPGPCGRSSSARRSSRPLYLRKPDAEINWPTRDAVR